MSTEAANSSPNHPRHLARWERLAHEKDPSLDGDKLTEYAEQLRAEHYRELNREAAQRRRARNAKEGS